MYRIGGFERLDYLSKKTGKQVQGYKLLLLYEKRNVTGFWYQEEYISQKVADKSGFVPEYNQVIDLRYSKFGDKLVVDEVIVQPAK